MRILVLEDDAGLRQMLATTLRGDGHKVDVADSGEDAVALSTSGEHQLVITDIKVKGVDGLEALRRIKNDRPDLESIVMTGYSTEAESIRAVKLSVGEYLKKPFELEQLLAAVARAEERIRARLLAIEHERFLSSFAFWSLRALARDESLVHAGLEKGDLAVRVGEAFGLPVTLCEDLRIATVIRATRPPSAEHEAPSAAFESEASQEARLARDILDTVADFPTVETRLTPFVRNLSRRQRAADEKLLSAGYLCEVAGQLEAAIASYEAFVAGDSRPYKKTETLLRIGRLQALGGLRTESDQTVARALLLLEELPPSVHPDLLLEAGLIRATLGSRTALEHLEQAVRTSSPGSGAALLGRLALGLLGRGPKSWIEECLTALMSPRNCDLFFEASWWMLPGLLRNLQSDVARRCLGRLVLEAPSAVARTAEKKNLAEEAQVALVQSVLDLLGLDHARALVGPLLEESPFPSVRGLAPQSSPGNPKLQRTLRVVLFGGLEIYLGDQAADERDLGGKKGVFLLARLLTANGPVGGEILQEELWPDGKSTRRIGQAISALRKVLRADEGEVIKKSAAGYALDPDFPLWCDYREMDSIFKSIEAGHQARPEELERQFQSVRRLCRGPLLPSCYLDWALDLREVTERRTISALLSLVGSASKSAQTELARACAEHILELDPCHQEAAVASMEASVALGSSAEALRTFARLEESLKVELGVEPSIDCLRARQKALLLG